MGVPTWTKEGTYDESSLLVGSWSEVIAKVLAGTEYHIGNVPEGVLEIGREFYDHIDTSFPRKTDMVVTTRCWMKFSGKVEEIHKQNVSWLLGKTLAPTSNYVYVGNLSSLYHFTFFGSRLRPHDQTRIHFRMHKCLVRSLFSLGSADEANGSPLEVEALDDSDGDYGGSVTGPLGWIWVPTVTP